MSCPEPPLVYLTLNMSLRQPSCYLNYFILIQQVQNPCRGTSSREWWLVVWILPISISPPWDSSFRISVSFLITQRDQQRTGIKKRDLPAPLEKTRPCICPSTLFSPIAAQFLHWLVLKTLLQTPLLDLLPTEWLACSSFTCQPWSKCFIMLSFF